MPCWYLNILSRLFPSNICDNFQFKHVTSGFSPTPSDSSPLPKQTLETKIEVQTEENINSVKNTEAFEAVIKVIYSGTLYERLTKGQAFTQ